MAIIISGLSTCGICGNVIAEGDPIIMFSPFIWNELDPLHFFSDAGFHADCFQAHPSAERALAREQELHDNSGPGHRDCAVCRATITDPDDYFFTGHFSDDPLAPLHAFNYLHLHRSCIHHWTEREEFVRLVRDLRSSGSWKGPALDYLLNVIDSLEGNSTRL